MNKIDEKTCRNVLFNFLAGMKTRENAERNNISIGKVSEIVNDYLVRLKDKDPEAMGDLAIFCERQKIDFAKLASSVRLHNALRMHGSDKAEDELDEWITRLILLSKESPEKVAKVIDEVLIISKRDGEAPIQTLERIKQLKQEKKLEEAKLSILEDQTAKANSICDEALAEAGLTKEYGKLYIAAAKKLNGWGLNTVERIIQLLEEMQRLGMDPKRAVAELTLNEKQKKDRKEIIDENTRLAGEQERMCAKNNLVRLLYSLPLSEEVWMKFSIKAHARALERREDVDTAAERILIDLLDNYDPVHGLKIPILKLHNLKETLEKEVGALDLTRTNMTNTNRSLQQDNEKEAKRKRELQNDVNLMEKYKTKLQNDLTEIEGRIPKLNAERKILLEAEKQHQGAAAAVSAQTVEPKVVDKSGVVFLGSGVTTLHSGYVSTSGFLSNNT